MNLAEQTSHTDLPPVLVLDDEPSIRDVIASCLGLVGYEVVQADAGWRALALARQRAFRLFLLDVNLPDTTGFEVCEQLRRDGIETPVMFLTARDGGPDAAHGLRIGGDDYLRKPFDLSELVARVDRLVARPGTDSTSEVLLCDDLRLDTAAVTAHRGGVAIDLTPTEIRTLEVLMRNQGRVLTRFQLLDLVWGDDDRDPAMVDTVVSRMRRKVHALGSPIVQTRRGVGYGIFSTRTTGKGSSQR